MKCLICNQRFYIKRGLLDLFETKKEFICNPCYKKYPIALGYEKVLLEDHDCIIISMFKSKYRINYNSFINEYSKIFNSYYKTGRYHVLFYEYINVTDYRLMILDTISKLVDKDLLIITFYSQK